MPRVSNKNTAKKVPVEIIPRDSPIGFRMYALLDELIEQHHPAKRAASIALMFNKSWTEDIDGNITITRVTLASDFIRELQKEFDVVIQVLHGWWQNDAVPPIQRRYELDRALCSFEPVLDKNGEPAEDERRRKLWRHRAPDIQAYTETVERYGLDITSRGQALAAAIKRSPATFKGCDLCRADTTCPPGWIADGAGVKRCSCWTQHLQIQQELQEVG